MTKDIEKRRRQDREARKRWRQTHPEEYAKRRIALRPRWRAANQRYGRRHPERRLQQWRKYAALHPERRKESVSKWRAKNKLRWDANVIRYELAEQWKVSPAVIPDEIVFRRAILRNVRRDLRKLLP